MSLSLNTLLPVIGGIGGALFGPSGSAALNAALGSGIGTLVAGGDAKDAIKNAVLGGGATAGLGAMGVGPAAAQSATGAAATKAATEAAATKAATEAATQEAAKSGILGSGISVGDVVVGSSLLSMAGVGDEELEEAGDAKLEARPDYQGEAIAGLFVDPVTGKTYDTVEELEEAIKARNNMAMGGIVTLNKGGLIEGPGTGVSDDIKAGIYQNGKKVQEARLSNDEFVMTQKAVKGAGDGDTNLGAKRMYAMMDKFERMA